MVGLIVVSYGCSLPQRLDPPGGTLRRRMVDFHYFELDLVRSRTVLFACLKWLLCAWNSFWSNLALARHLPWFSRSPSHVGRMS